MLFTSFVLRAMRKVCLPLSLVFLAAAGAMAQLSSVPGGEPFQVKLGSSFAASSARPTGGVTRRDIISDLREAISIIRKNHQNGNDVDLDRLTKSSISSMLAELDPHSEYFDAAEFSSLLGDQESEYTGTGSSITNFIRSGASDTYVISTEAGSPASIAGLRYGDRIIAVNGEPVKGWSSEAVRDRVRGPSGTMVRITVERAGSDKVETITMSRERVMQPSVPNFFLLPGEVGYIGLTDGFAKSTAAEVQNAIDDLRTRGAKRLVLDLRGNSGGILEQAVRVAEVFLPAGRIIISQRGRHSVDNRKWVSANASPEQLPLVILVDEQTASAAEVVAGALQDNRRALIAGRATFGKGLVQNVIGLPAGAGLTLTSARYYTPSGRSIQRNYSGLGRYAYFTADQTSGVQNAASSGKRAPSGQGILPDQAVNAEAFDTEKARLIDPVFFFTRAKLARSTAYPARCVPTSDPMTEFRAYLRSEGWMIPADILASNENFLVDQLRYQIVLACLGANGAARARIETDTEVRAAITALPRAGALVNRKPFFYGVRTVKKPARSHSRRAKVETGGIRKTVRSRTK